MYWCAPIENHLPTLLLHTRISILYLNPKDLSLPKKKSLLVNEWSKVDEILLTVSNALLLQRIAEIERKESETLARRNLVEVDLKTLESCFSLLSTKANCS